MEPTAIRTARLDLVAATLAHVDAELAGPETLAEILGATVPPSWPPGEYDHDAQRFFRAQLAASGEALVGWLTWYGLARDAQGGPGALVAGAGFFGPPAEGSVEIGYSVVPEARRQGYAREFVDALCAYAFEHGGVSSVIAHTTDENVASSRVLAASGFTREGVGEAPGMVRWRRVRPGTAAP